MRRRILAVCLILLVGSTLAAEGVKSGPQVGSKKLPAFNPLNVTGAGAGSRTSQVLKNGVNPVVLIFARDISDNLTSLIKKIDEATVKNSADRMGAFIVFCSADSHLEDKLKELEKKEKLKKIVLTIDNPSGPAGYDLAKEADITVILYTKRTVKANYAFKKGEMKDTDISAIIADVVNILPEKK